MKVSDTNIDQKYLDTLVSWFRKKWYNKTIDITEDVTSNREKFIFHIKYYIDNINYPNVTFDSDQCNSFRVWKIYAPSKTFTPFEKKDERILYSHPAIVGPFEDHTKCQYFKLKK